MKQFIAILSFLLVSFTSAFAQDISPTDLDRFRVDAQKSTDFNAKQELISYKLLSDILIPDVDNTLLNGVFTHIIKSGKVTNQEGSGRCWIFAGLNMIRYDVAKKLNTDNFEFSENYLFFFHKLELANILLEQAITGTLDLDDPGLAWKLRNGLSDGGYWEMFSALINKYGAVPRSAMPETYHSMRTRELNSLLDPLVKKWFIQLVDLRTSKLGVSLATLRQIKMCALTEIYTFLALMLGTPPKSFEWTYKDVAGRSSELETHTPLSFSKKYVKDILNNKVHLIHDPALPFYRYYTLRDSKNIIESESGLLFNVPSSIIIESLRESVMADQPVWFGSDVVKYANFQSGLLDPLQFDYERLFGISFDINKADRLRTYNTAATHAMVFMGVDITPTGEPVKWLIENSWGVNAGIDGYLVATTEWVQEYVFDIIVDRYHIAPFYVDTRYSPPTELPAWHHLWHDIK